MSSVWVCPPHVGVSSMCGRVSYVWVCTFGHILCALHSHSLLHKQLGHGMFAKVPLGY